MLLRTVADDPLVTEDLFASLLLVATLDDDELLTEFDRLLSTYLGAGLNVL